MMNIRRSFDTFGMGLIFLVLCLFFWTQSDRFLTPQNFSNLLVQSTVNIIIATGMTFVICAAEIDLSVGSLLALCGMITAFTLRCDPETGLNLPMSFAGYVQSALPYLFPGVFGWWLLAGGLFLVISLLPGILAGLLTGLMVVKFSVPSFIVTLGLMMIDRGLARYLTNAQQITGMPLPFMTIGSGWLQIGGRDILPYSVIIAFSIVIIGALLLSRSRFGRNILAVGGNIQASYLSGVPVNRTRCLAFAVSGFCVAAASIVQTSRIFIGDPNAGEGYELNAIAAVIIGGASLFGGKGSVLGTLFGALIIGVLRNGLDLMGVTDHIKQIVIGAMIVLAVLLDYYRRKLYRSA
ncbi:MAG: ABC transporter permease [Candidatus Omnitrophota bacterium]